MKTKTRDNLIYLVVGLSVAGVLVGLILHADNHGQILVFPSRFAFRAVTSTLLVGYFVARAARRASATLAEVIVCVLAAGLLHLAITFGFRQIVGQLPGLLYAGIAAIETFLIVELTTWVGPYFRRMAHSGRANSR
jgi:hypothetical protein